MSILQNVNGEYVPFLKGGAFFIDNSTYEVLMECERKAFYQIVRKRQPKGRANPLNFGSAVHAGLDARYKVGGIATDTLPMQLQSAMGFLEGNPTDDWRTAELLIDVLSLYSRTYQCEDFEVLSNSETGEKFVELPFGVEFGEIELVEETLLPSLNDDGSMSMLTLSKIPVVWSGKIDLVVIHNGKYWLVDHKTTSMFGDSYFEQYRMSSQFLGYKWALEKTLGIKIEGVMINVLAIRKPTKTGKGCTFHRQWMPAPDHAVPEWRDNTLTNITNWFQCLLDGYVPMRTTSCRTKWHSNCQYINVCTMLPQSREVYLMTGDFEEVTWSPLRGDE